MAGPERTDTGAAGETVASARQEFHCPACGAEALWNPARQTLACPFCGTEWPGASAGVPGSTPIAEHELVAALRAVADEARGWQATKTSVRCQSCRAISVFDPDRVGQRCEFCGSAALVPYEQVKDAFRPESLLPLRIPETDARERLRAWYRRQWLAPSGFRRRALTDTVTGVYLPFWTFDAAVEARWTAESGEYDYVQRGGKRVRQVRWRPASGQVARRFDDALVPASQGIAAALLRRIEPFPTDALVPYDSAYVAGWIVERYQIDLVAAANHARQRMIAEVRAMCARDVPGDTHRNLVVTPTFSAQTFKHILAPVWLLTYTHGPTTYQAVVNGVTGQVAGTRPWSWPKIAGLALLLLMILVIVAVVSR